MPEIMLALQDCTEIIEHLEPWQVYVQLLFCIADSKFAAETKSRKEPAETKTLDRRNKNAAPQKQIRYLFLPKGPADTKTLGRRNKNDRPQQHPQKQTAETNLDIQNSNPLQT